jgi:hypothetical protein
VCLLSCLCYDTAKVISGVPPGVFQQVLLCTPLSRGWRERERSLVSVFECSGCCKTFESFVF